MKFSEFFKTFKVTEYTVYEGCLVISVKPM